MGKDILGRNLRKRDCVLCRLTSLGKHSRVIADASARPHDSRANGSNLSECYSTVLSFEDPPETGNLLKQETSLHQVGGLHLHQLGEPASWHTLSPLGQCLGSGCLRHTGGANQPQLTAGATRETSFSSDRSKSRGKFTLPKCHQRVE